MLCKEQCVLWFHGGSHCFHSLACQDVSLTVFRPLDDSTFIPSESHLPLFRHLDMFLTSYQNSVKKLWSQIQLFKGNADHWKTLRLFKIVSTVEITLSERKYNKGRKCEPRYVKSRSRCPAKTVTSLAYGFDSRATHVLALLETMLGIVWEPLSISHREDSNLLVLIHQLLSWLLMFYTTILC